MAMTDSELFEFYRTGQFSKPAGMGDQEYESTMNSALTAQKNKLLQDTLTSQQSAIARAQTSAQQGASIGYDKLNRYLGQTQLALGLAAGQAGTRQIQAANNYSQNRAAIANNATTQRSDALQVYNNGQLQNYDDWWKNQQEIFNRYAELGRTDAEKQALHDREMFDMYMQDYLADDEVSDDEYDEALALIRKYSSGAGGNEAQKLQDYLDYYAAASKKTGGGVSETDAEFNNNGGGASYKVGDNFSVKLSDGTIYRVQSGGEVTDTTLLNSAKKIAENKVFIYNDKLYLKKNSRVYIITARDNSHKNAYSDLYNAIKNASTAK